MATTELRHVMPPALPEKIADWRRFLKAERTINDLVEDVHRILVDDEEDGPAYRALLRAVYDEQAVEGSLAADNTFAAIMIRKRAQEMESELKNEKAATISKALGIVMRRYHASRKQRRNELEGQTVPNDENGPGE